MQANDLLEVDSRHDKFLNMSFLPPDRLLCQMGNNYG